MIILGILFAGWFLYLYRHDLRGWIVETLAQAHLEGHLRVEREVDSRLRKRVEDIRVEEGRPEREPLTFSSETPSADWSKK